MFDCCSSWHEHRCDGHPVWQELCLDVRSVEQGHHAGDRRHGVHPHDRHPGQVDAAFTRGQRLGRQRQDWLRQDPVFPGALRRAHLQAQMILRVEWFEIYIRLTLSGATSFASSVDGSSLASLGADSSWSGLDSEMIKMTCNALAKLCRLKCLLK